jgi:hypothetical protein
MNLSEQQSERLEAQGSAPSNVFGATMLSLWLATLNLPVEAVVSDELFLGNKNIVLTSNALPGTNEPVFYQKNKYGEIMEAMGKAYDHLLASQKDLDETAARILYENLWNLYE